MVRQLKSPHLWLVVAMLAFLTVPQYAEQLGVSNPPSLSSLLGLTRYAAERILYLLPIAYACFLLSPRVGIGTSFVSMFLMLPGAAFFSTATVDAVLEMALVTVFGIMSCLYLEARRRWQGQTEQDLLELKQARETLQLQLDLLGSDERRLAALNEISGLITQTLEVKQVLSSAIEKVAETMKVEVVLIFRVNEETEELELIAHRGVSQEFVAAVDRLKVGEGFNGWVAATGEPRVVEDTSGDPRLSREEVRAEGLYAQLIVPLKSEGRVIGTLCVGVRQPRQFLADDIELLSTIGNAIGIALENAFLYEEQKRVAAELQASEAKYRALFEGAHDAIWVHDFEGNITTANHATAKLTGYEMEELLRMNVRSLLSAEGLQRAQEMRAKLLRAEVVHNDTLEQPYEQQLIRKDGTMASLRLSTSLATTDGKPTGFQHIARDVTEEKRMQENVRFFLQEAVRAQEEERKRIARELHDDTAQLLGSLSRQLDNLLRKKPRLAAEDLAFLEDLRQQLNQGLREVHRFSQDLRPSILDDLGLLPALRLLVTEMQERYGTDTALKVLGSERRFAPEVELSLFRVVQEALSNVRKHALASKAEVVIEFAEAGTKVSISDNGRGLGLAEGVDDLPRSGRLGLAGIQERVRLLGGALKLQSAPGQGTTLMVEIPG